MCDVLCLRIKIYELTCKRLQWKKLIEILFEVTIYQSQHLMKNLGFFSSAEAEKMLVACTFENNLRFEQKWVWGKTSMVVHSGEKTQIFWEISDSRKSQPWWPRGLKESSLKMSSQLRWAKTYHSNWSFQLNRALPFGVANKYLKTYKMT